MSTTDIQRCYDRPGIIDTGVMTSWQKRADADNLGSGTPPWLAREVWAALVAEVREHRDRGFGALLTEDTVRFCAARALAAAGVDAAWLRVEVPHPMLTGARIDLAVARNHRHYVGHPPGDRSPTRPTSRRRSSQPGRVSGRPARTPNDDALTLSSNPTATRIARDGAPREIVEAIQAVLTRAGSDTFTPAEIIAEMTRPGTRYAEFTIRIMITAHLCRNAPDNATTTYDDLERTHRGRYRLTST